MGQVKKLTGIPNVSSEFFESIYDIVTSLNLINWADFTVGIISLVVLFALKHLKDRFNSRETTLQTIFWGVGSIRNAIIVICTGLVAYFANLEENYGLTLTGFIPSGIPDISFPKMEETFISNNGTEVTWTFGDMAKNIGAGFIIVPIMAYLESYAMAKSFSRKEKYHIDGGQEMVAIGAGCFLNSFFSGFPVTGSFSRSSINNQCDVASPMAGFFTGGLVIFSLYFLTDLFFYIPKSSLAAVIILAASAMFDWKIFKQNIVQTHSGFV